MHFLNFKLYHLVVFHFLTYIVTGRHVARHKRVPIADHRWPNDSEIAAFEDRIRQKGLIEIKGTKIVNMGCWRDAWDRAVTPLEGRHFLLMDPNYKTRTHALYKCAHAAMDNHLKMFGVENGGQCMGSANADSVYKRHGPASGCKADGKGGPWSLQVYRFMFAPVKRLNGNYSDWSQWTPCTKTCGKGVQRRMRKCSHPAPANGGEDCSRLGPSVESAACNTNPCLARDVQTNGIPVASDGNLEEDLGTEDSHVTNTQTLNQQKSINLVQPKTKLTTKVGQPIHSAVLTAEAESELVQPLMNHRLAQYMTKPKMQPLTATAVSAVPEPASECLCPSKVCKAKGEVGFVVDSSSVVPVTEFIRALQLVKALSRGFQDRETHFGLVAYGTQTKKAFDLESPPDFQQLDELIDSASYMGGEAKTGNALSNAQSTLFAQKARKDAPKALILVSSGGSIDDVTTPSSDVRDSGVKITAVGLGKFASVNELINVASEPKSEHVFTAFFERKTLPRTIDGIVQAVCKDLLGNLREQKDECTCDNKQPPTPGLASGDTSQGIVALSKVKYAGVAQQGGLKHRLIKPKDEPIVLSVPEAITPQNIQPASSQQTPTGSSSRLPLPEPALPIVAEKDSENGTIPSLPSDSEQQLGITTISAIPQNSNRKMSPVLSQPSTNQDCKVNLAVLLDGSATVEGYGKGNFRRLLQLVKKFTRSFPVSPDGNRLSLVVYSTEPKTIFDFQKFSDQASIDQEIDRVSYPNKEVLTGKALKFAAQTLFSRSPRGKDVLLLITDGPSFDDVRQPAIELKRLGVEVFCLGVGQGYAKNQLEMIASDPVNEHMFTSPFKGTENVIGQVKDGICRASQNTDDSIAFSPPNKKTYIAGLHAPGRPVSDSHIAYPPKRRGNLYHLLNDIIR